MPRLGGRDQGLPAPRHRGHRLRGDQLQLQQRGQASDGSEAVLWQVRQYLAATGDTAFFRAEESGASGCDLLRAVAEFWASRVSCAEAGAGVCEIKQVPRYTRDHT